MQQQSQVAREEDVLQLLGKQAAELRSKLGESLASIQKFDVPLEQATTSSLEALHAYTLGVKEQYLANYPSAVTLLRCATDLDPKFAMAYVHLGSSYWYGGQQELGQENYQKAYLLGGNVTEREKFHIEALYYTNVTGEIEKAVQVLELWKSIYPQDSVAHILLSVHYERLGQYEKELVEASAAFRTRPTPLTCFNLAGANVNLSRLREADELLANAESRELAKQDLPVLSYAAAFLRHDPSKMEQIVRAAPSGSRLEIWLLAEQSKTETYYGRLTREREFTRRAIELARHLRLDEDASSIDASAALREASFGNSTEARRYAAKALSLGRTIDVMSAASLAYARSGDPSKAQAVVDQLARKYPADTILTMRTLPLVRAAMSLNRNNSLQAVETLQSATSLELGDLQVPYTRGQAFLTLHLGSEAGAEFQKILDYPGVVLNNPLGTLAYLGMARAYALEGDTAKSRTEYEVFLTLWKDADPDIPIYQQAQAEYAKLQ